MKFSIVTISYNQGQFIERAIQSVLSQYGHDIEYIIIDAGSQDGTKEVLNEYSSQISKLITEPDRGPADGLNKGLFFATGDFFVYLNADDYLLPNAISKFLTFYASDPHHDVYYGHGIFVDSNERLIKRAFSSTWNLKRYAFGQATVIQQATFIRTSALKPSLCFNQENRTCWDGELLVDLTLSGARFKRMDDYFGAFRIHPDSITGKGNHQEVSREDHRRLFWKIMNRPMTVFDELILSKIHQSVRWIVDWRIMLRKIRDKFREFAANQKA